ncbi:DUF2167 domain-containing protein [bacterium]|nr:DUF2167 domain-containing protein [bacterium]
MKNLAHAIAICFVLTAIAARAQEAEPQSPGKSVKFQEGPSIGNLGDIAQVRVPAGYVFAGPKETATLMEAMHNPVGGTEKGFIAPSGKDWFVVFEFDDIGYVKDDEKGKLDADAMLASIKRGNDAGNKERRRRGWAELRIVGWALPPSYNETTHNLEWAIKGESEGKPLVNYNTRILGRSGVMRITLVTDPETLAATIPDFKKVLEGFEFNAGGRYAEYRQGDKIAEYGLSALVVGGATAVALKSGFFKYIWKILVVVFVAVSAFFKKVFGGRKSEY